MEKQIPKSGVKDDDASARHPLLPPPASPLQEENSPEAFTPAGQGIPFGWHIAAAIGAGVCVAALYFSLATGIERSSWFHAFLFDRSFVQWVILYAFFFGIGLLVQRSLLYAGEVKAFRLTREQQLHGDSATRVCRRFRRLKSAVETRPITEVHEYSKQLAEADASDLEFGYHVVGELIQIIPLLGFFGTVLGLSRGLHKDFLSELAQAASGIKSFVGAIGTAFDTTLLGLACTIVLIILQLMVRKREELLLADLDRMTENFVARNCKVSPQSSGSAVLQPHAHDQHSEHFQRIVSETSNSLRSEMAKIPALMSGQFQTELSAAATRILEQSAQRHPAALDEETVRLLAVALREQLQPFQQSMQTLAQEQSRTAETVSNSIRENTDRFCQQINEILKRPRHISVVERPEDKL